MLHGSTGIWFQRPNIFFSKKSVSSFYVHEIVNEVRFNGIRMLNHTRPWRYLPLPADFTDDSKNRSFGISAPIKWSKISIQTPDWKKSNLFHGFQYECLTALAMVCFFIILFILWALRSEGRSFWMVLDIHRDILTLRAFWRCARGASCTKKRFFLGERKVSKTSLNWAIQKTRWSRCSIASYW